MTGATRKVTLGMDGKNFEAGADAIARKNAFLEASLTKVAGAVVKLGGYQENWVKTAAGNFQRQVTMMHGILASGERVFVNYGKTVHNSKNWINDWTNVTYKAATAASAKTAALMALNAAQARTGAAGVGLGGAAGVGLGGVATKGLMSYQQAQTQIMNSWLAMNPAIVKSASGVQKLGVRTRSAGTHTSGMLLSWQSMARLLTVQIFHRAFASLTSALRDGFKASLDLQRSIGEIRTISQSLHADLTKQEWERGIFAVAKTWGVAWKDVTEGIYQATSNQVAFGEGALYFMDSAAKLSMATVSTITESVNALSSVINAYGYHIGMADEISAQLFKTVELGRVRLKEMHSSMGDIVIMAAQLGIEYSEVGAAIATITNQGMKFNRAATQLRGIMMKLIKPTEDMKELLDSFGLTSGEELTQLVGAKGLFEVFRVYAEGSSTELAKVMPLVRGLSALISLTSEHGSQRFKTSLEKMEDATASFEKAVERTMETTAKQVELLKAKLSELFISDYGTQFQNYFVGITTAIPNIEEGIRTLINSLGSLAAGFILVKLAMKGWAGAKWLVSGPIGWAVGALALIVQAYMRINTAIATEARVAKEVLDKANKDFLEGGLKFSAQMIKSVDESTNNMKKIGIAAAATYRRELNGMYRGFSDKLDFAVKAGGKAFDAVDKSVDKHLDSIDSAISKYQELQSTMEKAITASKFEAGQTLFSLSLEDKDLDSQYRLTINRLKHISDLRSKSNSMEALQQYAAEEKTLIGRAHQLRRSILEHNKKVGEAQVAQKENLEEQNFELDIMRRKMAGVKDAEERREMAAEIYRKEREIAKISKEDTGVTFGVPDFNAQQKYLQYYSSLESDIKKLKAVAHEEEKKRIKERADLEISLIDYRIAYEEMKRYDAKAAGEKLTSKEDLAAEISKRESVWEAYYKSASAVGANIDPKQREAYMRLQSMEVRELERATTYNMVNESAKKLSLSAEKVKSSFRLLTEEVDNLRNLLVRQKTTRDEISQVQAGDKSLQAASSLLAERARLRDQLQTVRERGPTVDSEEGRTAQYLSTWALEQRLVSVSEKIASTGAESKVFFADRMLDTSKRQVKNTQSLLDATMSERASVEKEMAAALEALKSNKEIMREYGISVDAITGEMDKAKPAAEGARDGLRGFNAELLKIQEIARGFRATPAPTTGNRPTGSVDMTRELNNINVNINGANDAVATNVISTIKRAQYGGVL